MLGVGAVSLATPLVSETVRLRWFDFPRTLPLMLLPVVSVAAGVAVWVALGRLKRGALATEWLPFAGATAIFVLAFAGLGYSLFPYLVIERLTIWQAAADPSALRFVLVGALIVVPFIIAYTVFAHRVFWGKARAQLYD